MSNNDFRGGLREFNYDGGEYTSGKPRKRYTAPNGMGRSVYDKTRNKIPDLRLAALIMAAAIGVGALTAKGFIRENEGNEGNYAITEISERQQACLGLNAETVQKLREYSEFFQDENNSKGIIYEQDLLDMVEGIERLHFLVVKEKIGTLLNVNPEEVKMYYGSENGEDTTRVVINENNYDAQVYSIGDFLQNKNTIPEEMADRIKQLEDIGDLRVKIVSDKISKSNAIKELKGIFGDLEKFAISNLIIDERGNISVSSYSRHQIKGLGER